MDAGICSNMKGNSKSPGGGDEEGTRLFIIHVKEDVERCLVAGMSKEQMFRELREKGLHLAIAFAVYKELRDQNDGFFGEYYGKIDLRKQADRFQRLMHQYRPARDAAAGARELRMATAPITMAIPHNVGSSGHHAAPAGSHRGRLIGSSSGYGQFAGSAPSQQAGSAPSLQAGQLQAREQLHPSEHWFPNGNGNGGVRGLPSAGPFNTVMTGSWPPSCSGLGQCHGEQAEPLQQWLSNPSCRRCPEKSSYHHYRQRS